MPSFLKYIIQEYPQLLEQVAEHIGLTFLSLMIAVMVGLPLGVFITRKEKLAAAILGFTGVLQTIPSIALLGFLIPVLGIGVQPAIFALFLYALLPIVRNTFTGIQGVAPTIKEAALGMGMTNWQLLWKVELPLAIPVIFAGIRTATVINVGVTTLAAYIAAGGLGEFIFGGIALNNTDMILAGAIPAALLAIIFDVALASVQRLSFQKIQKVAIGFLGFVFVVAVIQIIPFLQPQTKLVVGFDPEFLGRADGYPAIQKKYGLEFEIKTMNASLMYEAVQEGEVDVISGYSTDGRIKAFGLATLEDDRQVFPPYFASLIARQETLETYPELRKVLEKLSNKISDSVMTQLNYEVDFLKKSPEEVARTFLKSLDLSWENKRVKTETLLIGSKTFTEQYLLVEIFAQLIEGHTHFKVEKKTGLGGTKICFDALVAGEIDFYPEYTGTGLQVMLQPESQILDSLIADNEKVFQYVNMNFQKEYGVEWLAPLGFNNTYALMMTGEKAAQWKVKRISDLKRVLE